MHEHIRDYLYGVEGVGVDEMQPQHSHDSAREALEERLGEPYDAVDYDDIFCYRGYGGQPGA